MTTEQRNPLKTPWNPSRSATARVTDPAPVQETCHHCGGEVIIVNNSSIYGEEYGEWPWAYFCGGCRSYVGMHPFTNIPLGRVANPEERAQRRQVKLLFNNFWIRARMKRRDAYTWLAEKLNLPAAECHFGLFNVEMCAKAEAVIDARLQHDREERQRAREKKYGKKRKGAPK